MFSIMQQVKLRIFLPVVMIDLLHNMNVFVCFFFTLLLIWKFFFWNMTDASGPAYCSLLRLSRFSKDDRILSGQLRSDDNFKFTKCYAVV